MQCTYEREREREKVFIQTKEINMLEKQDTKINNDKAKQVNDMCKCTSVFLVSDSH